MNKNYYQYLKKKTNIIKHKLIRTLKNLNKNNFVNVIYMSRT